MAKLSDIKSKNWTLSTEEIGVIVQRYDEISQSIMVIVKTQKRSDPLRPDFGCDLFLFLDRPISEAIPRMINAIIEALELWEQRIDVNKITYVIDMGSIFFEIQWAERVNNTEFSTVVPIKLLG